MLNLVELLTDATRDSSEAATKTFTILAQRLPAAPMFHLLGLIKEDRESRKPTIRNYAAFAIAKLGSWADRSGIELPLKRTPK